MLQTPESIGSSRMVKNVELAKKVEDREEENRLLREQLVEMETKLDVVQAKTEEVSEKVKVSEGKEKVVAIEDEVPEPDPILLEEPFLRALKDMGGKSLEGVPLFSGKMEP